MLLEPITADALLGTLARARAFRCRFEVVDAAVDMSLPTGLILEFGVFEGATTNHIASRLPARTVHGFDSFEGLPQRWRPGFRAGAFSTEGRLPPVRGNVSLVSGWFDDTLPLFCAGNDEAVALLHVDCDLYSSTRCVFDHLGDRLVPGSVIVFDEFYNYPGWEQHEFRAFAEFSVRRGLHTEIIAYNAHHEQVAMRVVG